MQLTPLLTPPQAGSDLKPSRTGGPLKGQPAPTGFSNLLAAVSGEAGPGRVRSGPLSGVGVVRAAGTEPGAAGPDGTLPVITAPDAGSPTSDTPEPSETVTPNPQGPGTVPVRTGSPQPDILGGGLEAGADPNRDSRPAPEAGAPQLDLTGRVKGRGDDRTGTGPDASPPVSPEPDDQPPGTFGPAPAQRADIRTPGVLTLNPAPTDVRSLPGPETGPRPAPARPGRIGTGQDSDPRLDVTSAAVATDGPEPQIAPAPPGAPLAGIATSGPAAGEGRVPPATGPSPRDPATGPVAREPDAAPQAPPATLRPMPGPEGDGIRRIFSTPPVSSGAGALSGPVGPLTAPTGTGVGRGNGDRTATSAPLPAGVQNRPLGPVEGLPPPEGAPGAARSAAGALTPEGAADPVWPMAGSGGSDARGVVQADQALAAQKAHTVGLEPEGRAARVGETGPFAVQASPPSTSPKAAQDPRQAQAPIAAPAVQGRVPDRPLHVSAGVQSGEPPAPLSPTGLTGPGGSAGPSGNGRPQQSAVGGLTSSRPAGQTGTAAPPALVDPVADLSAGPEPDPVAPRAEQASQTGGPKPGAQTVPTPTSLSALLGDRVALSKHVSRQIQLPSGGETRTQITLRPDGLGTVEIDLSTDPSGRLSVLMRVENPTVLQALRADRELLLMNLDQTGFDLDGARLDFEGFGSGSGPDGGDRGPGPYRAAGRETGLTVPSAPLTSRTPLIGGGRLDLYT